MAKRYRGKNREATSLLTMPLLAKLRLATSLLTCKSLLLPLLLLPVVGCGSAGPRTYPISGTVTFDGEAVPDGYIIFTGSDSTIPPVTGKIVDGKYSSRVTADTHRVEIQASRLVGPENPIMGLRAKAQYVPDRYNIESILSVVVEPTGNHLFPFELTSTVEAAP